MKWLTLNYIKAHSRICHNAEDDMLELYGESAEDTVLNVIGRTYDEVVEKFGKENQPIPAPIMQASLMLVEQSYTHRAPVSQQQLYAIPYGFDMLIKRYVKLTYDTEE